MVFVLATTEAHKVPPTIVDRCHRFDFQRPSLEQIAFVLKRVAEQEEIEVPDPALGMIARAATGSFRDALGTLEQLVTYGGKNDELDNVLEILGVADAELVLDAAGALVDRDPKAALACVQTLSDSGRDFTQFMRDLTSHLRHLLVVQVTGEFPESFSVTAAHPDRVTAQADRIAQGEIVRAIEFLGAAVAAVKEGSDPRIQLELALLKSTQPQADLSLQALMYRIEQLERRLGGAGGASAPEQPEAPRGTPAPRGGGAPSAGAAAQAVAEPENEPVAEAAPAPDLEHVQQIWPAVADAVRERNGMLGALLAQARPIAIEGDLLKVAFAEDATFGKKKAEANRELVVEALRGITGRGLTVAYELSATAAQGPALLSRGGTAGTATLGVRRNRGGRRRGRKLIVAKQPNLNQMMKQVQQMQAEMAKAQEELKSATVEASAGGGMVTVKMSGELELLELRIDPEAVDPEDVELLQDMGAGRRERGDPLRPGAGGLEDGPGHRRPGQPGRPGPAGVLGVPSTA